MIFKNYTFGENVILKCNLFIILKNKLKLGYLCTMTVLSPFSFSVCVLQIRLFSS